MFHCHPRAWSVLPLLDLQIGPPVTILHHNLILLNKKLFLYVYFDIQFSETTGLSLEFLLCCAAYGVLDSSQMKDQTRLMIIFKSTFLFL